jgi:hypothetical protein
MREDRSGREADRGEEDVAIIRLVWDAGATKPAFGRQPRALASPSTVLPGVTAPVSAGVTDRGPSRAAESLTCDRVTDPRVGHSAKSCARGRLRRSSTISTSAAQTNCRDHRFRTRTARQASA